MGQVFWHWTPSLVYSWHLRHKPGDCNCVGLYLGPLFYLSGHLGVSLSMPCCLCYYSSGRTSNIIYMGMYITSNTKTSLETVFKQNSE